MPFSFSSINKFVLLVLFKLFVLPSHSVTMICPEVPKDVLKGDEGEVCYRRPNGFSPYFFVGKKIAGEPDSKIYKAYEFKEGIWPLKRKSGQTFAVKVVSTGTSARALNLAKPPVMIKHELHMLKLFNELEANKPVDEQSVVELFTGDVVVDKSPFVVAHESLPFHLDLKRDFSMIYIMEFGDSTLDSHLMQWDNLLGDKWTDKAKQYRPMLEEQIKQDAEQLLLKLANTLSIFHKYAVHLHLKPGNWIFIREETKWKLIDLQSAIPNFEQNNGTALLQSADERFPEDFVEFACNSLGNEIFLTKLIAKANQRPSTYASPDHISACKRALPILRSQRRPFGVKVPNRAEMEAQLRRIGPKCDVWSLGVLMLEILAHTAQVNPSDQRMDPLDIFIKTRAEFVSDSFFSRNRMGKRQHFEEFAHFKGKRKKVRMDGKKLDIKSGKYMERIQKHFPAVFRALLRIFAKDSNDRAELSEIVQILKG